MESEISNQLIKFGIEDSTFPLQSRQPINSFSSIYNEEGHWHSNKRKFTLRRTEEYLIRQNTLLITFYEKMARTNARREENFETEFSQKLYTAWEVQKEKLSAKLEEEKALGNKFYSEGKYSDAIKHYENALLIKPNDSNHVQIYVRKGLCHEHLSEWNLAIQSLKKGFLELDTSGKFREEIEENEKKSKEKKEKKEEKGRNTKVSKEESKTKEDSKTVSQVTISSIKPLKSEKELLNAFDKSKDFSSLEEAARLGIDCLFHILEEEIKKLKKKYLDEIPTETKGQEKFNIEWISKVFLRTYDIIFNFKDYLTEQEKARLVQTLNSLSFGKKAQRILFNYRKEITFEKLFPQITQKINLNYEVFELKYMGEEMIKRVNPVYTKHPDINFNPDSWQHDLIELINKDKSVLVTAPTSSGKSFISFYTISRILEKEKKEKKERKKEDDPRDFVVSDCMKSRIVFISPTKPLAIQMGINIYQKYGNVFGIYTSDYRINETNCKILITIPEMFEVLLFSPQNHEWSQNLKYCIFDEVHMACREAFFDSKNEPEKDDNDNDNFNYDEEHSIQISSSYARILSLVDCPFLALSASIKNPVSFVRWLKRTRTNSSNNEIHIIPKEKEDINYVGEPIQRWADIELKYFLPSLNNENSKIISVHPISILSQNNFSNLKNVSLTPRESLQLYESLLHVLPLEISNSFKEKFSPENYFQFKNEDRIEKNEAKQYSFDLLNFLSSLDEIIIQKVILDLHTPDPRLEKSYNIEENIYDLFCDMKKQNILPSICFYLNQEGIEKCIKKLVETLQIFDKEVNEQSKVDVDTNDDKTMINLLKKRSLEINRTKSFINGDIFEYEYWFKRLFGKIRWTSTNPFLVGLLYGIGAHHNGLPKVYRDIVEVLFRAKILSIVISTTTLQVGVDMPAKCVAFIQSKHITPSQFRQMQGRAGRRGQDTIGYTVFFNIRPSKISEWITGPDPKFQFDDVLDINTILRMLIFYNQKPESIETLKKLMIPSGNDQLSKLKNKLIFQFSLEVLYQIQLINEEGKPIGLAGLVSHNAEMYPYNLLLSYLILTNSFTSITEEELLLCLTYFFNSINKLPTTEYPLPSLNPTLDNGFKQFQTLIQNIKVNVSQTISNFQNSKQVLDEILPTTFTYSNNPLVVKFYELKGGTKGLRGSLKYCNLSESGAYFKLNHFQSLLKKINTSVDNLGISTNAFGQKINTLTENFAKMMRAITY